MITRIVKLSIKAENKQKLIALFLNYKNKIILSEGCLSVELLQDKNDENTFFTYSKWENNEALENYRSSELFAIIWPKVKLLFNLKAQAWTVSKLESAKNIQTP